MGRMDTLEQWVAVILGGGLIGSAVTWLTSRHRPKVDTAQMVLTGSDSLINNLQEERDRLDRRIDAVERRATKAENRAAAAERSAANAAAENLALLQHHLDTLRGVAAGTVPPWLPIPHRLAHLLSHNDLPVIKSKESP